ncbi:cellulose synthase (UDP-forming) [Allocatelliglobosispora scoriae]|uniref:Cellulose synthase (UDP-forming) n=1 Tax=Allocatelliglobosispora scoriae TaxID=643052 RepID=A0A841BTA0_9ACTN|nr:cellulose synthase catalytic subunit [Allocatelliglobosispora scoriae]MBB5871434.1 cellulose synthase (UDP-forming) [Allocatelliglobosispora scoriae]
MSTMPVAVSPPGDEELFWYFGPQRRWVLLCVSASYTFTAVTLFLFSLRHPALWVFLGVLALNIVAWSMSLVDGQKQRRLTRQSHELLVRSWDPVDKPSIDVFLPSAGEQLGILRNTYTHVSKLEWDGPLVIWVLDDAASSEVRALAAEFGFEYRTRPDRGHLKKAGNLNFGYAESTGDLIAIFDADFCPRPDFLRHLVPYFEDPTVGIAQSPQCFDTRSEMTWVERAAGAAQEMFFRWLQPSRDADDAAICCGTNAIYRRTALAAIDGFPKLSHSEDMFTGIEMRKVGFRTQYVPVLLAKGLSPDTLTAFVNQQYRWCMGNLELMVNRDFHRMRLPWRVRLAFWNGFTSYFVNALNVFTVPLPAVIMLWFYPGDIRPWHMVPFLAPAWIWFVLLPAVSKTRWRFEVTRAQLLYSIVHAVAIVHLIRRRTAAWVPTGAAAVKSPLARTTSKLAIGWLLASNAVAWGGLAYAIALHGWANLWAAGGFILANTYLALPLIRDAVVTLLPDRPRRTLLTAEVSS